MQYRPEGRRNHVHGSEDLHCTDRWMEEIPISPQRASRPKGKATPQEVSAIRGALGTVAWRANQVSPQFLEDVGLMHFEVPLPVPVASVDLILRINKVIQEAKRMADQTLVSILLTRAAMVTWADAAQNKGVNKGSTIGMLTCIAPIRILEDDRVPMNIVAWRIQSEGTKGGAGIQWQRSSSHYGWRVYDVSGALSLARHPRPSSGAWTSRRDGQEADNWGTGDGFALNL